MLVPDDGVRMQAASIEATGEPKDEPIFRSWRPALLPIHTVCLAVFGPRQSTPRRSKVAPLILPFELIETLAEELTGPLKRIGGQSGVAEQHPRGAPGDAGSTVLGSRPRPRTAASSLRGVMSGHADRRSHTTT